MKAHCCLVGVLLSAMLAGATDYTWNGVSGAFQSASSWSPSTGYPGVADKALFTTAGTSTVSFTDVATNASATVGASGGVDVTLALNGYSWVLTGTLSFTGTGVARIGGGALDVGTSVTVAANQKLVLNSGTSIFRGSQLGTSSGGAIEVNGGNHILVWALPLGSAPSGGVSFRMTGGSMTLTNWAESTRITMNDGSKISLEGGSLTIAYIPDVYGSRANPTVFDIYTNASFNSHNYGLNVSRGYAGLGTVNVRGGSLVISNSSLQMVNAKTPPSAITTGIVNLVDGLIYSRIINVGLTSNSVAILHQTGGSLQVPTDFYMGKDTNAFGLFVQEGGSAYCGQFYIGGAAGGTGEVDLVGGTLVAANNVTAVGKAANACGRLLQTGGSLVFSNSISVGVGAGSFGVVTNTGGSLWLNSTLYLGNGAGSFGRAYFSGASNWVSTGITVGSTSFGTGELVVAGGSLIMPNNGLTVGNQTNSVGRVVISGGQNFFKGVTIGNSGIGDLSITGGTLVLTNAGAWMVGNSTGSVGTVTISGGTNIFQGQGSTFGQFGYGRLRIEGGYSYTTNRLVVGGGGSGTGRLELAGGVLSTPIIDGRDPTLATNPGGYSEVLFDGGTLQHSVDGEWWMPGGFVSTFAKATLTDRGAVIDSNGGVLTITQALSNEVGYAGSFTKTGLGKLTLSSWYNAFTGRVSVIQGELAVSSAGAICLSGGVAVNSGAILNLASASALRGLMTTSGTVSQIDGALTLKSGTVLTNGVGATLGGSGVVTGSVVFATGSFYGRDQSTDAGALRVTGSAAFQSSVAVALTGYTAQQLEGEIPLLTAGSLQMAGNKIPVTLDGASHPYWWATVSSDGKTLTARVIRSGTIISVR